MTDSDISTPSVRYKRMAEKWELIEDLMEGRDKMIEQATKWLPREPEETLDSYKVRLERSFLFGAFSNTVKKLAAKPFTREVVIKNDKKLPPEMRDFHLNVDLQGTDLTSFSNDMLEMGQMYGHAIVLVDFPRIPGNAKGEKVTLADERRLNARPYWVLISPSNLIFWREEVQGGKRVLQEIRYRETRIVPDGEFGDKEITIIRQIFAPTYAMDPDGVEVEVSKGHVVEWAQNEDKEWTIKEAYDHTYPGIPVTWLPINPDGAKIFQSSPPFQELAEANLEHWQKSSDMSNILRFVSIAMVLLTGVEDEISFDNVETGGASKVKWGVNQILRGQVGADGKYIEHSGEGIGALHKHISRLEDHMEQFGLQPLVAKQSEVTATAQRKDDQKVTSEIQSWIRRVEKTLLELYTISARWIGKEAVFKQTGNDDEDITFDVFNEFGLKVISRDDGDMLLQARRDGQISLETFLTEWKKRGIIGEEVGVAAEVQRLGSEKSNEPSTPIDSNSDISTDIDKTELPPQE